jgi:hypothetical protein
MLKRNALLVVAGILLGCAAESVVHQTGGGRVRAAANAVDQYCTTTHDFNNVEALDTLVTNAGRKGWALIGVYRPAPMGATHEDYVCFRREEP